MPKSFISISPLGSVYVLGIPLTGSVDFALSELDKLGVKENQNCVYVENVRINTEFPDLKNNIVFSKSRNAAWHGRVESISMNIFDLNINQCEQIWVYFKSFFERMNLTYSLENKGDACYLNYKTRLCKISILKQYGINTNPNICPFRISISSKYLDEKEYNAELINTLFHDKVEYEPIDNQREKRKSINIKFLFALIFSTVLCILFYLIALNGRYIKIDEYSVFDKWQSEYIEY